MRNKTLARLEKVTLLAKPTFLHIDVLAALGQGEAIKACANAVLDNQSMRDRSGSTIFL